jgi:hypothetical protein
MTDRVEPVVRPAPGAVMARAARTEHAFDILIFWLVLSSTNEESCSRALGAPFKEPAPSQQHPLDPTFAGA